MKKNFINPFPLKGKIETNPWLGASARVEDIRNAVYWYLENSNCGNPDCKCCGKRDRNIFKAFEDVIQKSIKEYRLNK